ncbi:MAG: hypothetical protein ABEJ24_01575, partial [Candidatus Magasanikbacteria bacterium]
MFSFFGGKIKKETLGKIGTVVILFGLGFQLLKPKKVHAVPVEVIGNPVQQALKATKNAAMMTAMQFVNNWINRMAYDAAKSISRSAAGKKPLIHEKSVGQYLKDTAEAAGAKTIQNVLSGNLGSGLCKTKDTEFNAGLKASLAFDLPGVSPPEGVKGIDGSGCQWTQFTGGLDSEEYRRRNPNMSAQERDENFTETFMRQTGFNKSKFGTAMKASVKVNEKIAEAEAQASVARQAQGGFKPVKSKASRRIKTPSESVEKEAPTAKGQRQQKQQAFFATLGSGMLSALTSGAGIFLSTLAQDMLDQLLSPSKGGGLAPTGGGEGIASEFAGPATGYREAAEKAFSFLVTNPPSVSANKINLINKFGTCPEAPRIRGKNNCVIGSGLRQAIMRAKSGDPLTLREALEQGIIANKPLIPPDHESNGSKNCYKQGYCYSNIKKLRKARILPLGFQIAAKNADADQLSWNLKKVMDNFQNCNRGQGPMRDTEHPFCHLIDPNWVIKSPEYLCVGNEETGPQLARAGGSERKDRCTNIKSCVKGEAPGEKCKAYGYCVKEENVWRLPGQKCPAHFNTCTTYFDENNQAQSYLSRTVNFSQCNAGNVGCRAYSLEKQNDEWLSSVEGITNSSSENRGLKLKEGRNKTIHFDEDVEGRTCSKSDWGCSEFFAGNLIGTSTLVKSNQKLHLKQAPSYLGCYDAKPNTAETDRPQTIAEAKSALNNSKQCNNFAAACVKKEVGCKDWKPVSKPGDKLPAKIGGNTCPRECVGYGTFRQRETVFSPAVNQLNFIPSDGRQCSANLEGCSEFTNMSEKAAGGERLEYYTDLRSCEEPTENNQKTFYTWEGKEGEGFRLKKHTLAVYIDDNPNNDQDYEDDYDFIQKLLGSNIAGGTTPKTEEFFATGSPKYNSFDEKQLTDFYNQCNEEAYKKLIQNPRDPDADASNCRRYIDEDGNRYYRLASKLRTVSDQCHRLRKTETNLAVNENISNFSSPEDVCTQDRGGTWGDVDNDGNDECGVCRGGGTYENGYCFYKTVSTPGGANSCRGPANNPDKFKGCRAYEGTTAGNVVTIFDDIFEPNANTSSAFKAARSDWTAEANTSQNLSVVGAALQAQMHSLKANFNNSSYIEREIEANTLTKSTDQMSKKIKYKVSFWARGASQSLEISLHQNKQQGTKQVGDFTSISPVSISGVWRKYEVGPTTFTGDPSVTTTIRFNPQDDKEIFIDNVKLTEREGAVYLIKDSWKRTVNYQGQEVQADAPLRCDADPTDNTPGSQLGCSLYEDSLGNQQAAKEFERLCRPDAVGCRPMFKTYNSDSPQEQWFKVEATTSTKGAEARIRYEEKLQQGTTTTILGACQTRPEETSCFVDQITIPDADKVKHYYGPQMSKLDYEGFAKEYVGPSTMVVPEDQTSSTPIYITDRKEFRCDESKQGCSKVAQQKQTLPDESSTSSYSFGAPEFLLNDPDNYLSDQGGSGTLCRENLIGCKRYSKQDETVFFKDPEIAGARSCKYREDITPTIGGSPQTPEEVDGWFKEGVGVCSYGKNKPNPPQVRECNTNSDCKFNSSGTTVTGTCKRKGTIPCYSAAQTIAGDYKIRSNKSNNYEGFVGKCPASQNMCREFVDRANKKRLAKGGKSYYRIFNENFKQEVMGQCNGQVSLKNGCVLMDNTFKPAQKYNTEKTYKRSRQSSKNREKYAPVDPATTGKLDADMIFKVERDRQCKQWWSCTAQKSIYQNGSRQSVCTEYSLCNKASEGGDCLTPISSGGTGYCSETPGQSCVSDDVCPSNNCIFPEPLTTQNYVERDTSFYGTEYSGGSVLNLYNINQLKSFDFSNLVGSQITRYLAYVVPQNFFRQNQSQANPRGRYFNLSCRKVKKVKGGQDRLVNKENWSKCGGIRGKDGRCWDGKCIKPVKYGVGFPSRLDEDTFKNTNTTTAFKNMIEPYLTGGRCKTYPEEDSPFPQSVLSAPLSEQRTLDDTATPTRTQFIRKKTKPKDYTNANVCQEGSCSCLYKKVEYSNQEVDYWDFSTTIEDASTTEKIPGICQSGPHKGKFCDSDSDCSKGNQPGDCQKPESISRQIGSFGFCLERDRSRVINGGAENPCITWFPTPGSASNFSTFNNFREAGYYPPKDAAGSGKKAKQIRGGKAYCLVSKGYGSGLDHKDATLINVSGYSNVFFTDKSWGGFLKPIIDYRAVLEDATGKSGSNADEDLDFMKSGSDACGEKFSGGDMMLSKAKSAARKCANNNKLMKAKAPGEFYVGTGDHDKNNNNNIALYATKLNVSCNKYPRKVVGKPMTASYKSYNRGKFDAIHEKDADPTAGLDLTTYFNTWKNLSHSFNSFDLQGATHYTQLACFGSEGADSNQQNNNEFNGLIAEWGKQNVDPGKGAAALLLRLEQGPEGKVNMPQTKSFGITNNDEYYSLVPNMKNNNKKWDKKLSYSANGNKTNSFKSDYKAENGTIGDRLYISQFQKNLRESWINNVYFVPVRIPDGEGNKAFLPPLFTKNWRIPLSKLKYKDKDGVINIKQSGIQVDNTKDGEFPSPLKVWFDKKDPADGDKKGGLKPKKDDLQKISGYYSYKRNTKGGKTRYVTVFYPEVKKGGKVEDVKKPSFINKSSEKKALEEGKCNSWDNWIALGMEFGKNGEFLGYVSRYCHQQRTGDNHGVQLAVFTMMKDQCNIGGSVYKSQGLTTANAANKAFTNRVWSNNINNKIKGFYSQNESGAIPRKLKNKPFGTINLSHDELKNKGNLINYTFTKSKNGAPLRCNLGDKNSLSGNACWNMYENYDYTKGALKSIINHQPRKLKEVRNKVLDNIFAKFFLIRNLRKKANKQVTKNIDKSGRSRHSNPPQIYSVNRYSCKQKKTQTGVQRTKECLPAEANNISINGETGFARNYNNDRLMKDPSRADNQIEDAGTSVRDWDGLVGVGSFKATARFFAFADHNHMPIRRVSFCWGDKKKC